MKKWIGLLSCIFTFHAFAQNKTKYDGFVDSLKHIGQPDKLIPYFLKELSKKPKDEAVLRWLGFLYIENSQFETGLKYYDNALKVNPKCARCYMNIGGVYTFKKDHKKAIEFLNKAIDTDPNDGLLYAVRAKEKAQQEDKLGAMMDFNKAIKLSPKEPDCFILRANQYASQGELNLAIADITEAIELNPTYDVYYQRSNFFYNKQMFKESLEDINTAISIDSGRADLYFSRGAIYAASNENTKAITEYNRSISIDPDNFIGYYNRAMVKHTLEDMDGYCADINNAYDLLKKNDPGNKLIEELEFSKLSYCDSSRASYYYQRGVAFYNLGQYEKAVDIYTIAVKKFPSNSMNLSFRGNAYLKLKKYEEALTDYYNSLKYKERLAEDIKVNQRLTQVTGESINTYVNVFLASTQLSIAEIKFNQGRYDEALTAINKAIEMLPVIKDFDTEDYYFLRGNIFLALEKFEDASADFDKCISINSSKPAAYVYRAIAKVNTGEKTRITSYFIGGAVSNQAFSPHWNFPIKTTTKKTDNNIKSALADCNKAISLDPKLDYAYYVRSYIKKMLGYTDFCIDLIQAKELGYPVEAERMIECGK